MTLLETLSKRFGQARAMISKLLGRDTPLIPLVRMEGMIAPTDRAGGVLNLQRVAKPLNKAFAIQSAPLVAITVNSPGGSPVQSRMIHERIRLLAKQYDKKVLVFCEDVAASGGYMIASAGDEIFADPSSIVGSIGVISAGFGFTEVMTKLGVERRVKTAGKSKSLSDPFLPETDEQKDRMDRLLKAIHAQFITLVETAREGKLNPSMELFDGSVFTGEEAIEAGLIDGIGEARQTLQERYGDDVRIKVLAPPRAGLLSRMTGAAYDTLEQRLIWSRFGL